MAIDTGRPCRPTLPLDDDNYEPDLPTFSEDTRQLLDHLGIAQVVFVGESFGGIIGLQFAHT
jgi:pimeloyl-ACP methyl ester carboxylesterase